MTKSQSGFGQVVGYAQCPAGKRVIGGGAGTQSSGMLVQSEPRATMNVYDSWVGVATGGFFQVTIQVYAICANVQ